MDYLNAHQSI